MYNIGLTVYSVNKNHLLILFTTTSCWFKNKYAGAEQKEEATHTKWQPNIKANNPSILLANIDEWRK